MSNTVTAEALSPVSSRPTGRVLVCAPRSEDDEPLVVLADGTYETTRERVFWRDQPDGEVLRLPLTVPVAIRPVRQFPLPRRAKGEEELLAAVRASRSTARPETGIPPQAGTDLGTQLRGALESGDTHTAHALASLLEQRAGLDTVYGTMSACLAELASGWAAGTGSVLAEHLATRTASQVAERLRALAAPATRCGTVVLAVPPGEHHVLGLTALAHLLQEAGWPVRLVDDLPAEELAGLAGEPGTIAVVLSTHVDLPAAQARRLLAQLRESAPDVLLVLGGPGLPRTTQSLGADLVTDDVAELLRTLEERSSVLTGRERQVLLAVADGRTNAEIAERLGVAPATVKSHLDNIFTKTNTEHRAAAVARALRRGWIH